MTRAEIEQDIIAFAAQKRGWLVYTQVERWLNWQVDVSELWETLFALVDRKVLKKNYKQRNIPQFRLA